MPNLRQSLSIKLIKVIQKYAPHTVVVLDRTYEISENVFNPKYYFTSKFMAEHVRPSPADRVLDMGTGSGIQAITAARTARKVVAVDINPEAVRFARKNVIANGLTGKVSIMHGDLFSPLNPEDRFDVILFTPPYLDGKPETLLEHALIDPDKGLAKRFFSSARQYLSLGGYVQMLYSSIAGHESLLKIIRDLGWELSLLAKSSTWSETFFIYRLTPVDRKN